MTSATQVDSQVKQLVLDHFTAHYADAWTALKTLAIETAKKFREYANGNTLAANALKEEVRKWNAQPFHDSFSTEEGIISALHELETKQEGVVAAIAAAELVLRKRLEDFLAMTSEDRDTLILFLHHVEETAPELLPSVLRDYGRTAFEEIKEIFLGVVPKLERLPGAHERPSSSGLREGVFTQRATPRYRGLN